jgi:hypothetical protein
MIKKRSAVVGTRPVKNSLIDSISSGDENSQTQVRSGDASAQVPPVSTSLVRYGTARRALAEAHRVDEVRTGSHKASRAAASLAGRT